MDEKKQEGTPEVSIDTAVNDVPQTSSPEEMIVDGSTSVTEVVDTLNNHNESPILNDNVAELATDAAAETGPQTTSQFNVKAYVVSVLIILLVSLGLIFILEKEGKISTGLFTGVISSMEAKKAVAKVNDSVIIKGDLDSSMQQLITMASNQGLDTTDQTAFRDQAINTLINAELLRQAALSAGKIATPEAIEARFNEIRDGIGGADELNIRLAEFGITEKSLRRDIENEILIQDLFDNDLGISAIEVTDEEVKTFYDQAVAAAGAGDIPSLEEVKGQIIEQIQTNKKQELIDAYIKKIRDEAKIEILI